VLVTVALGVEGSGLLPWTGGPRVLFWVLPKRNIAKPNPHGKGIIQQESLGTDICTHVIEN